MRAQDDGTTYHRIQIMRIGDFKVLVDTEVDAIDEQDQPVEIKARFPSRYFGTELMFQMISSGSRLELHFGLAQDTDCQLSNLNIIVSVLYVDG